MSKSYRGHRMGTSAQVWVLDHAGGHVLDQFESLRIRMHNPSRFEWGYGGSGASQLALAMLLEHTKDPAIAAAHYQDFQEVFVENWRRDHFELRGDEIDAWLSGRQQTVTI